MDQQDTAATGSRGVATFTVEIFIAVLIFAFGLTVLFGSRNLGSGWTSDGPGAGYFPFYIGLILCIASAGIIWQTIRQGYFPPLVEVRVRVMCAAPEGAGFVATFDELRLDKS